jgi:hypothetical protein
MTNYYTGSSRMDIKSIATRAVVTALEAAIAVLLASGLTDLSPELAEGVAVAAGAAGLSVIYNSLRQYLEVAD